MAELWGCLNNGKRKLKNKHQQNSGREKKITCGWNVKCQSLMCKNVSKGKINS